jgi:hypothetical protein
MSKLTDEQKKTLAKAMMKAVLSKMTPEQRKVYFANVNKMAYNIEIHKKLHKHEKTFSYLTIPLIPLTTLIQILKVLTLKKMYIKQALVLAKNLKTLNAMKSGLSLNLISPERKKTKGKTQEDYVS